MNATRQDHLRIDECVNQLLKPVQVSNLLFARDGRSLIISSNITGFFNAYSIPIKGGVSRRLTFSNDIHVRPIMAFPLDGRILMTRDPGSRENTQLFVLLPDGAELTLQDNPEVKVRFLGFIPDSDSFYCLSNQRSARAFDLYIVNPTTVEWTLIYRNDEALLPCGVSRDSRFLALMRINSSNDAEIFLYDLERSQFADLSISRKGGYCRFASFDPSSTHLYYLTDENYEWTYVVEVQISTGTSRVIRKMNLGILQYWFSRSGRFKVIYLDDFGSTKVQIFDRQSRKSIRLNDNCRGSVGKLAFSLDESLVAYTIESCSAPARLLIHNFATAETSQVHWTSGELEACFGNAEPNVQATSVSFASFDGLQIPAFLWHLLRVPENEKRPGLVWVHGGPGGQIRDVYHSRINCLASAGYVVIACNYRGSFGCGRSFFEADIGKQGNDPLLDLIHAKRFLCSLSYVDSERIGIIGSSFGGYMVLAALAFHPEEFAAGVNICGISDWISALETLPDHWDTCQKKSLYQKVGHPQQDRDRLTQISPLFHAERISKPLLVLQGANDPRVKRSQSDRLVAAVREHGGSVEYLVFEDEAHGLRQPVNIAKAYTTILNFLDRHLHFHESARA